MTKITIPKCRNPFVVIMNGIRYEYESGKEVEVPDEVAAIIQFHVDSKPKPMPIIGGGGGGVCNRPHVYFSDSADKLPTDAVDGSMAVVKTESKIIGTWVFKDDLTLDTSLKASVIFEGLLYGSLTLCAGIEWGTSDPGADTLYYIGKEGTGMAAVYTYNNPYNMTVGWKDAPSKTIKILEEPEDENFIGWLNLNATYTPPDTPAVISTLYSRINGEWVNQGVGDFTDLASV